MGELISFDTMPGAGRLVPGGLRPAWHPIYESTAAALPAALAARRPGFLLHDSDESYENQMFEFGAAWDRRGGGLVLISVRDHVGALADFAGAHGMRCSSPSSRAIISNSGRVIGIAASD